MKITRQLIKQHLDTAFIYGDTIYHDAQNSSQCKECRGEPNAFAVATKIRSCANDPSSYFKDEPEEVFGICLQLINKSITDVVNQTIDKDKYPKVYVLPKIGMGFNRMDEKAPRLLDYIWRQLKSHYGSRLISSLK